MQAEREGEGGGEGQGRGGGGAKGERGSHIFLIPVSAFPLFQNLSDPLMTLPCLYFGTIIFPLFGSQFSKVLFK